MAVGGGVFVGVDVTETMVTLAAGGVAAGGVKAGEQAVRQATNNKIKR